MNIVSKITDALQPLVGHKWNGCRDVALFTIGTYCNADNHLRILTCALSISSQSQSHHSMVTRSKLGIHIPKTFTVTTDPSNLEPLIVNQALSDPRWKEAMQAEFDAFMANHTWTLVPYKPDMNVQ